MASSLKTRWGTVESGSPLLRLRRPCLALNMQFSVHQKSWFGLKQALVVKTFLGKVNLIEIFRNLRKFLNQDRQDVIPDRRSLLKIKC